MTLQQQAPIFNNETGATPLSSIPMPVKRGPGRPRKRPFPTEFFEDGTPDNVRASSSSLPRNEKKRNADGQIKIAHSSKNNSAKTKKSPRKRPKTSSSPTDVKFKKSSASTSIAEKKLTPLDELRNESLRDKESALAKVVDNHDSLVRELYYMENFNLLIWDLDRQKLKQDNSERMVKVCSFILL